MLKYDLRFCFVTTLVIFKFKITTLCITRHLYQTHHLNCKIQKHIQATYLVEQSQCMKLHKSCPWLNCFLNLIAPPFYNLWRRLIRGSKISRQYIWNILNRGIDSINTWSRWMPLTKAALATTGFLSTIPCFRYRSIWVRSVPSVMRQRTRIELVLYI